MVRRARLLAVVRIHKTRSYDSQVKVLVAVYGGHDRRVAVNKAPS